jgi:hypothetical protein
MGLAKHDDMIQALAADRSPVAGSKPGVPSPTPIEAKQKISGGFRSEDGAISASKASTPADGSAACARKVWSMRESKLPSAAFVTDTPDRLDRTVAVNDRGCATPHRTD